jgi:hypothetical protein
MRRVPSTRVHQPSLQLHVRSSLCHAMPESVLDGLVHARTLEVCAWPKRDLQKLAYQRKLNKNYASMLVMSIAIDPCMQQCRRCLCPVRICVLIGRLSRRLRLFVSVGVRLASHSSPSRTPSTDRRKESARCDRGSCARYRCRCSPCRVSSPRMRREEGATPSCHCIDDRYQACRALHRLRHHHPMAYRRHPPIVHSDSPHTAARVHRCRTRIATAAASAPMPRHRV